MKRKTSRGKYINFDELIAQQPGTPALGNMKVNAQGDRLGRGGEVLESNTRRVRAYYKDNPRSSTSNVTLKDPITGGAVRRPLTPDAMGNVEQGGGNAAVSERTVESGPARKKSRRSRAQDTAPDTDTQTLNDLVGEFDEQSEVADIEVITPDGDIIMMTPSEHQEYLDKQDSQE